MANQEPTGRVEIRGPVLSDYWLRRPENPQQLIVLLHGYTLNGEIMFRKFEPLLPPTAAVLALNGPFPMPELRDERYRVGFAWYFYNPATDEYYIDMRVATELLRGVLEKLGFESLPKTLIGFSQGGYLAPVAAERLLAVKQVIGIACRFLEDELHGIPAYSLDQVHGGVDDVVSLEGSRADHARLLARGATGSFAEVAGEGHRLSPAILAQTIALLG